MGPRDPSANSTLHVNKIFQGPNLIMWTKKNPETGVVGFFTYMRRILTSIVICLFWPILLHKSVKKK